MIPRFVTFEKVPRREKSRLHCHDMSCATSPRQNPPWWKTMYSWINHKFIHQKYGNGSKLWYQWPTEMIIFSWKPSINNFEPYPYGIILWMYIYNRSNFLEYKTNLIFHKSISEWWCPNDWRYSTAFTIHVPGSQMINSSDDIPTVNAIFHRYSIALPTCPTKTKHTKQTAKQTPIDYKSYHSSNRIS